MKKIGIFYGSSSGNTKSVAASIQQAFGADNADIIDIAKASVDQMNGYENLIFGTSTWGVGDLQDDWDAFLSQLGKVNFAGKKVALFGVGDSSSYSDTYVDGMGLLFEVIEKKANIVGAVDTADYTFDASVAVKDGKFVGLAIDEDNESNKTKARVNDWVAVLKTELL